MQDLFGFVKGGRHCGLNSDIIDTGIFEWEVNTIGRDGLYDDDQLFCIYENSDIESLINELKKCLK